MKFSPLSSRLRQTIRRDPILWAAACGVTLRPYQRQIALAVKDSILHHRGLTFVVVLPRQSGKNELQAHLFSWLLFRYAQSGGNIVSVSPTFKPQTVNNMLKVRQKSLDLCLGSRGLWKSNKGYIYQLGRATLTFFSGEPRANVVGATADLLLSVDEAQQVSTSKFDKDFSPMTASTNATRIFWGTAWTSDSLLERERRFALQAQQKDGLQRVFYYTADDVRRLVPAYGKSVDEAILKHGRNHPLVRTQYFCETLDAQSGMFNPARLLLMFGKGPEVEPGSPPQMGTFGEGSEGRSRLEPEPNVASDSPSLPGTIASEAMRSREQPGVESDSPSLVGKRPGVRSGVAFLLDVAGQDESKFNALDFNSGLGNPGRDATTLTIVEIDLSTLELLLHPAYHVLQRHAWVGENHLAIFGKLKNLAETWNPQYIVVDATGVGEGLWAMLDRQFPSCVIPVKFSQQEKSEIGWRFLSIIETGRFHDPHPTGEVRLQYSKCIMEILPGPAKTLRWGVPDGARGPDGELIHDDYILADALTAKLDGLEWHISCPTTIIQYPDPLIEMSRIKDIAWNELGSMKY